MNPVEVQDLKTGHEPYYELIFITNYVVENV